MRQSVCQVGPCTSQVGRQEIISQANLAGLRSYFRCKTSMSTLFVKLDYFKN